MSKTKSQLKRKPHGFGKGTKLIRRRQRIVFKITSAARLARGFAKCWEWGAEEDDTR